jgi:hypothetical protein
VAHPFQIKEKIQHKKRDSHDCDSFWIEAIVTSQIRFIEFILRLQNKNDFFDANFAFAFLAHLNKIRKISPATRMCRCPGLLAFSAAALSV